MPFVRVTFDPNGQAGRTVDDGTHVFIVNDSGNNVTIIDGANNFVLQPNVIASWTAKAGMIAFVGTAATSFLFGWGDFDLEAVPGVSQFTNSPLTVPNIGTGQTMFGVDVNGFLTVTIGASVTLASLPVLDNTGLGLISLPGVVYTNPMLATDELAEVAAALWADNAAGTPVRLIAATATPSSVTAGLVVRQPRASLKEVQDWAPTSLAAASAEASKATGAVQLAVGDRVSYSLSGGTGVLTTPGNDLVYVAIKGATSSKYYALAFQGETVAGVFDAPTAEKLNIVARNQDTVAHSMSGHWQAVNP